MWKNLEPLLSGDDSISETIISKIENGSLSVFMHVDEAELYEVTLEGQSGTLSIVGDKMLEIYPHLVVSIIRGAGPHKFNLLKTPKPYREYSDDDGQIYRSKPELHSVKQLFIREADFSSLEKSADVLVEVSPDRHFSKFKAIPLKQGTSDHH